MRKREPRPTDYPLLTDYKPTQFMLPTSHYDEKMADRAVRFIEMLPHTKAEWEGKPKLGETIHLGVNFSFVLQLFHCFASG